MLRLDLARLERASEQRLEGEIPADSTLWDDTHLSFGCPVSVALTARAMAEGGVFVEGRLGGLRVSECRRCLGEVREPFERSFTFYFVPAWSEGLTDPEVRLLPESGLELDLEPDVREELILVLSEYVVCREGCRGLCPNCGVDRNSGTCDCETSEPDPRWEALRATRD